MTSILRFMPDKDKRQPRILVQAKISKPLKMAVKKRLSLINRNKKRPTTIKDLIEAGMKAFLDETQKAM